VTQLGPIPYGRQQILPEDIQAVVEVLGSEFLTQGPAIAAFEEAFAEYVGARYAVAVSNGTAALHLAALALDVAPGTRVISTPITFAASCNCVAYCGGSIDFVDVQAENALLDPEKVAQLLDQHPPGTFAGIIPVDFAGAAVNLEPLRQLANQHGLWILEDACHAPGGYFTGSNGQQYRCGSGSHAELSIFSFHPVKHIACGEGGMITTQREDFYRRLLRLRTHGITREPDLLHENHGPWYYEMQELGYNYRLSDMQAALGLSQLKRARANLQRRREIAAFYDQAFESSQARPLGLQSRDGHAFHLYVIQVSRRRELYDYLRSQGIFAQVHYIPVHTLPYYQQLGHRKGSFPVAEAYYEGCLSLPMYPSMSQEQLDHVVSCVRAFLDSEEKDIPG